MEKISCLFIALVLTLMISCGEQPRPSVTAAKPVLLIVNKSAVSKPLAATVEWKQLGPFLNKRSDENGPGWDSLKQFLMSVKNKPYSHSSIKEYFDHFSIYFIPRGKKIDSIGGRGTGISIKDSMSYSSLKRLYHGIEGGNMVMVADKDTFTAMIAAQDGEIHSAFNYGWQITTVIVSGCTLIIVLAGGLLLYRVGKVGKKHFEEAAEKLTEQVREVSTSIGEDKEAVQRAEYYATLLESINSIPARVKIDMEVIALNKNKLDLPVEKVEKTSRSYYAFPENSVFASKIPSSNYNAVWIVNEQDQTYQLNRDRQQLVINHRDSFLPDSVAEIVNFFDVQSPSEIIMETPGKVKETTKGWEITERARIRLE